MNSGVRNKVVEYHNENPCIRAASIAKKFGVSRERIRQILTTEQLPTVPPPQSYICQNCNRVFVPSKYQVNTVFCSSKCRYEYTHPLIHCDYCGKPTRKNQSQLINVNRRFYFCSRRCLALHMVDTRLKKYTYDDEGIIILFKQGYTLQEIGNHFNIPWRSISNRIYKLRHKNGNILPNRYTKYNYDKKELISLINKGTKAKVIAKLLDIPINVVWRAKYRNKINRRT